MWEAAPSTVSAANVLGEPSLTTAYLEMLSAAGISDDLRSTLRGRPTHQWRDSTAPDLARTLVNWTWPSDLGSDAFLTIEDPELWEHTGAPVLGRGRDAIRKHAGRATASAIFAVGRLVGLHRMHLHEVAKLTGVGEHHLGWITDGDLLPDVETLLALERGLAITWEGAWLATGLGVDVGERLRRRRGCEPLARRVLAAAEHYNDPRPLRRAVEGALSELARAPRTAPPPGVTEFEALLPSPPLTTSKYYALYLDLLTELEGDITFDYRLDLLDALLRIRPPERGARGRPEKPGLPPSALRPSWWDNTAPRSAAWRAAGFRAGSLRRVPGFRGPEHDGAGWLVTFTSMPGREGWWPSRHRSPSDPKRRR